jgi:hypothetical protein
VLVGAAGRLRPLITHEDPRENFDPKRNVGAPAFPAFAIGGVLLIITAISP